MLWLNSDNSDPIFSSTFSTLMTNRGSYPACTERLFTSVCSTICVKLFPSFIPIHSSIRCHILLHFLTVFVWDHKVCQEE